MPAQRHFFITGTDTEVGKTWFTSWLVRSWRAEGHHAAGLKPISAGDRADAEQLRAAGENALSLDEINPIHLREPVAPLLAAQTEKREIDFRALNQEIGALRKRFTHLAVEGIGGWRVPLAPNYEVREWARDLGLPVVVVARAGVGTMNHTLLTLESIQAAQVKCAGVVLNPGPGGGHAPSPDFDLALRHAALLESLFRLPVFYLHRLAHAAGKVPVWLG